MVSSKLFVPLSAIFFGLAVGQLQDCGDARYDPAKYTCYDNDFLCPVVNGVPTQRCGPACYSPYMYSCSNKQLGLLPADNGPFTLTATNTRAPFEGETVEACGNRFWIGRGPCTYCPSPPVQSCPAGTNTVLYAGQGMDTVVPGGQVYYIEPAQGALGFTQAHSAYYPPGSVFGVNAYQKGAFVYLPGNGWTACPSEAYPGSYQVFQKLDGLTFNDTCVDFTILVKDWPSNVPGAWQYT